MAAAAIGLTPNRPGRRSSDWMGGGTAQRRTVSHHERREREAEIDKAGREGEHCGE